MERIYMMSLHNDKYAGREIRLTVGESREYTYEEEYGKLTNTVILTPGQVLREPTENEPGEGFVRITWPGAKSWTSDICSFREVRQ